MGTKPSYSDVAERSRSDGIIDYHQPPNALPIYMPARACKQDTTYHLEMETTADQTFNSESLPALERIIIISDPAYSRINR